MGADVAASPHCPVAVGYQAWEARQSAGRFRGGRRAGGSDHFPRGPSGARAPFGFPAGSPSGPKPWRFASADPEPESRLPPSPAPKPKLGAASGRKLRPKPQPCLAVHGLASWVRRFAAPGPKPGPARRLRGRNPFTAGGSAPTCVPLLPDRHRAEAPRLSFDPEPEGPKPGRFSKPAAFASAQGQARSFRLAAASSAALAFARPPHAWWDRRPLRSGRGWEGSPPLPVDRLGHGSEAVRESESRQGDSGCG
jgi:hypothetical protein